jgi:HK97 family phage major capsid protein
MGKILESLVAKGKKLTDEQREHLALVEELVAEAVSSDSGFGSFREEFRERMDANATTLEEFREDILKAAAQMDKLAAAGVSAATSDIRKVLEANKEAILAVRKTRGKAIAKFDLPLRAAATVTSGTPITGDVHIPMPDLDGQIGRIPQIAGNILDDVRATPTSKDMVVYLNELPIEGAPKFIGKGKQKPEMSFTYKNATTLVKKIAVIVKVWEEDLDDIDFLESDVYANIVRELRRVINLEIIQGGSTADDLSGIVPVATAYNNAAMAGLVVTPTTADALYAAAAQIWGAGYTGVVTAYMNPQDIAAMRLTKDTNGNYLNDAPALQGITIRQNPAIAAGEVLVGLMDKLNVRIRKNIEVEAIVGSIRDASGVIGTDDEFNCISFRGEARLAMYIKSNDTAAFVHGTLAAIKADITKADA